MDNGDINSETEIGRSNHCGFVNWMKFDGKGMNGCILSCDTDGCNAATPSHGHFGPIMILLTLGTAFSMWRKLML